MKYDIRHIFEYIITLVNEFAKRFGLSDKQTIPINGVAFIKQNYGISVQSISMRLWIALPPIRYRRQTIN